MFISRLSMAGDRRTMVIRMNGGWSDDQEWSDEETDNHLLADDRNFYEVKKWTKDGTKVDRLLLPVII